MVSPRPGGSPRSRTWLLAGLLASSLVALVDYERANEVILAAVVAGPLLAAVGAPATGVVIVGMYALALAFGLGAAHDIFLTSDHVIGVIVVAIGGVAAVASASVRQRRDAELEITRPAVADAQRLRLALDAGHMGTWRWDLGTGRVTWDERMEALFGLAPGTFDGTFAMYESLLHPEDREHVLDAVRGGMERNRPWHFDHRAAWPDGSVHWLEGRGEPVQGRPGAIVGASGVSINIDARHALLAAETRARRRPNGRPQCCSDLRRRQTRSRACRQSTRSVASSSNRRCARSTRARATSQRSMCRPTSW